MFDYILGSDIAFYVKRHKKLVFLSMALAAISSVFVVVPAALLQPFVDECMKTGSEPASWKIPWITFDPGSWLSWHRTERVLVESISPNRLLFILMCIVLISIMGKSITIYLSNYAAAAFSNRATKSMRIDLFKKFVALPLGFYHHRKSGELIARAANDITAMQSAIAKILIGLIEQPLTALVFLSYLLILNYKLTLFIFVLAPVMVGIMRLFGRKVKKHATRMQDAMADVTADYHETILCLKVVQGFFKGGYEVEKFRDLAQRLYKQIMHWRRWELGLGPMMDVSVFLIAPAALFAAKYYFDHSLGEILTIIFAFSKLYSPIKKLSQINNNLKTLQGMTKRVFGIMKTPSSVQDPPRAKALPRHRQSIEFRGMNFGFDTETLILKDITFKINAGEMVAFVGSTGAGKSTLLDLIPRFYDVTSGNITIDGVDIRDVSLETLRSQIGIVNQEILLFHDTIANNIIYGKADATPEEIEAAAKVANAHGFIMEQPNQYQTVIGDQGTMLYGGQRQRIAIARAILIDPTILILDEAASALDSESERLVQKAIDNLRGKQTILVVAHRLSTIMKANRIYVLEEGKIIESGSLKELLSLNGRFKKLYDMQFKNGEEGLS